MGGLRDELRRAKLLSGKTARKLDREERKREHEKRLAAQAGDEERLAELETDQDRRRRELQEEHEAERQAQIAAAAAAREARATRERQARIHTILDDNRVPPGGKDQTWCFVAGDGRIKELRVSRRVARALQRAELAIVERPEELAPEGSHRHVLVPWEVALRVEQLHPPAIRFWNHPERAGLPLLEPEAAAAAAEGVTVTHATGEATFDEAEFLQGLV
jgi:uncharacterized protein YaiL (DUF2058 family)